MTPAEYKTKLEASLKRSKNPGRNLLVKELAAAQGYAVDFHVMCGDKSSTAFFFKMEDVGKGDTSFFISDYANCCVRIFTEDLDAVDIMFVFERLAASDNKKCRQTYVNPLTFWEAVDVKGGES